VFYANFSFLLPHSLLKIFECHPEIASKSWAATERANGAFESTINGESASDGQLPDPKILNWLTTTDGK